MNVKSIMQLAISAVVILVVITAFVVPLISSATDHNVDFHNPAQYGAYRISDEMPVTLDYTDGVYSINGVVVSPLNANYSSVSSDALIIRWSAGQPTVRCLTGGSWQAFTPGYNFHIVAEDGHGSGTVGTTDVSFDYDFLYYQGTQDYTMTVGVDSFYLTSNSPVVCVGNNPTLSQYSNGQYFIMQGSIADGFTLTNLAGVSFVFKEVQYEKISGYDDLYNVTAIVFDNDGQDVIINRCIVPETVTVVKDHNSAIDSLVSLVPLLFVVSVVVAVVGSIALRPRD